MMTPTPPGTGRNAAHQGPVFLPWHRLMLMLLEASASAITVLLVAARAVNILR